MQKYYIVWVMLALFVPVVFPDLPANAFAGEESKGGASVSVEEESGPSDLRLFMIYFENDLFAGTDEYYTNAVKLTWLTKNIDRYEDVLPSWSNQITSSIPLVRQSSAQEKATHNIGFSLGHNIYTPEKTQKENLIEDDRPYAGWLYGSIALHRKKPRSLNTFELTVGIVGPSACGEITQNTVHEYGESPTAKGWDNELRDEPGVLLSWQQSRKPLIIERERAEFDFIPNYGLTLGNVFTYANLGGEARLGFNIPDDFGTSLIRPGSNLSSPMNPAGTSSDFGFHFFIGADGRAVLQNIFLDGNTWKDSHSVDKKHFVADLYAGLALTYGRFRLAYTHAFRTREFENQEDGQEFGSINISYSF
jgi:hypothetical protein